VPQPVILSHPLVEHHLSILRDKTTTPALFRQQIERLSMLLAYRVTENLPVADHAIETPVAPLITKQLAAKIALVPILRAGLGLVDPLLKLLPDAEVWHLGMYRDEATAKPVEYYCKLPEGGATDIAIVLDPMLATGGSTRMAIMTLKKWGVKDIRVFSVIAAQPGIDYVQQEYPDVAIYVCTVDPQLNSHKFIVPGLGDAGDRIFNTNA
jgi:uracil phosphoribosyltransferase